MRHPHTRLLFDYWNARRLGGAAAPARADIAPEDLAGLLPHLFILRRMDREHHVFRLAGSSLCGIHQREFKDQNFLSLWRGNDRAHMTALIEGALAGPAPATALAEARSMDGRGLNVEIALMPLRGPEGFVDRCLGLYQPLKGAGLSGRPAVRHVLREARPAVLPEGAIAVRPPVRGALAANDF